MTRRLPGALSAPTTKPEANGRHTPGLRGLRHKAHPALHHAAVDEQVGIEVADAEDVRRLPNKRVHRRTPVHVRVDPPPGRQIQRQLELTARPWSHRQLRYHAEVVMTKRMTFGRFSGEARLKEELTLEPKQARSDTTATVVVMAMTALPVLHSSSPRHALHARAPKGKSASHHPPPTRRHVSTTLPTTQKCEA